MVIVIVAFFGLIVGSFLNAVIHRLRSGESFLSGRSKCPHCGHALAAADLIPVVSFMFLGRRCRYCRKKISWQYPIVELVSAGTFLLLAHNFQFRISNFEFWTQLVFAGILIVIAVYDFKHYLILDKIVYPAIIFSLVINIFERDLPKGALGGFAVSMFFFAQYLFSGGRWIGFGDVKLGFLLGSILGLYQGAIGLVLAYLTGALLGVILIILGKKQLSSKLPFGTFLAGSAIVVMLYGDRLLEWYLELIGM